MESNEILNFLDGIFSQAIEENFAPEINDKGDIQFYYHEADPKVFIEKINTDFGMKVIKKEQFIYVDDECKQLSLMVHLSSISQSNMADFVVSCAPWMRSIKNATSPCYKQWEILDETENKQRRFCTDCKQDVYHVSTVEEIKEHVKARHCIAFDFGWVWVKKSDEEGFIGDPC